MVQTPTRLARANETPEEWIARGAIPFSLDAPERVDAAVDAVVASLGEGVELLGFGEALHGAEEILVLRNRLFRRLVEAHGFSAIAIESSFPRGRLVDEYVAGRGAASYEAVRETGFGHAFGGLDANRELVEWMRQYNANPAHRVALRFYGFDIPTGTNGIASPRVKSCILCAITSPRSIPPAATRAANGSTPLLGEDAAWENPAGMMNPAESVGRSPAAAALRVETEDLIADLRARRPELVAKGDGSRYAEALHHASVARELLNFHAAMADGSDQARRLGIRDALMADTLAYAVARERGRGKVLAFAHNSHLKRGMAGWHLGAETVAWWPAGAHLDQQFGPRYAVIGSGVGVSEANGIGRPEAGTLEALLTAAPGPGRFLPTRRGEGVPAAAAALPTRSGSARNPSYFPLTPERLDEFDWLAVLDAATYQRGGPSLTEWVATPEG